jgi:EpsI family protein
MVASRRDTLIGLSCVAASVGAFAATPRRHVALMANGRLESLTPAAFGAWTSRDVSDLVAPKVEGDLVSRLYDHTLERIYTDAVSGAAVMVLLAHGDTQSNELQLHRPEVCYPAFGFEIASSRIQPLLLGPSALLPTRILVAEAPGRRENILYWTRLGEFLPTSENEQRLDRVKTALHGAIADGLLARFSLVADDTASAAASLSGFVAAFIKAVTPDGRAGFVGTELARALANRAG